MKLLDRSVEPLPLWAKLERSDAETGLGWHSLVDHSADVAACMEALLTLPLVQSRLAALAGVERLPDVWVPRIASHAFLHDLGKANRGFRARLRKGAPPIGHVVQAVALMLNEELRERLFQALPVETMIAWGSYDDAFFSIVAHHGRPVALGSIIVSDHRDIWMPGSDCDPVADLVTLGTAVRHCFPTAFVEGGEQLPIRPPFWHAIAGLAMLADWIGSDTQVFPFANGEDPDRMRFARNQATQALRDLGVDPSVVRAGMGLATYHGLAYPLFCSSTTVATEMQPTFGRSTLSE